MIPLSSTRLHTHLWMAGIMTRGRICAARVITPFRQQRKTHPKAGDWAPTICGLACARAIVSASLSPASLLCRTTLMHKRREWNVNASSSARRLSPLHATSHIRTKIWPFPQKSVAKKDGLVVENFQRFLEIDFFTRNRTKKRVHRHLRLTDL